MLSDDLLDLQRIDSASDRLAHRRANLDERKQVETTAASLQRTRQQVTALIERQKELTAGIEDAERAGAELTQHRERLQAQLKTIASPREAEALMHELDTLAARRDALDDAELAQLEEQSQIIDDLAGLHAAEAEQAIESENAAAELAAAEAEIDAEIAQHTVQRSEAVARIDGGTLADYEERRARHGGVAITKLDGSRCGGCHLDLSTKESDAVKATPPGEFTECPQCGRMLVP